MEEETLAPTPYQELKEAAKGLEEALEFIAYESCCDSGIMLCCDNHENKAREALEKFRKVIK